MKKSNRTCCSHLESLEPRRLLSLSPAVSYPTGPAPHNVASGDFNGDGRPDLAVYNSNSTISVLRCNANGTFQPAQVSPGGGPGPSPYYVGPSPSSIAVGDFNRDGKLDLVTVMLWDGSVPGDVGVSLGNGDGTLRAPTRLWSATDTDLAGYPVSVTVGDVNGDGKLDLAVASIIPSDEASAGEAFADLFLGAGDGSFQPPQSMYLAELPDRACVTVGDFNGDGKSDVVVAVEGSGRMVAVILGAAGGLGSAFYSYVPDTVWSIAARDVNADGKLDLIAVGGHVSVLLGTGAGTFASLEESAAPSGVPGPVATADFNGDGKGRYRDGRLPVRYRLHAVGYRQRHIRIGDIRRVRDRGARGGNRRLQRRRPRGRRVGQLRFGQRFRAAQRRQLGHQHQSVRGPERRQLVHRRQLESQRRADRD
jgi:hypothetical protein